MVVVGCGGGGHTTKRRAYAGPLGPVAAVPVHPAGRTPALARLQTALTGASSMAGRGAGGYVYDLTDQTPLFALRARVMRPPASLEKLYTSVALLDQLGPNARLHTTVFGMGHLGPGGIWHGNLYLRGGGDPTFGDGLFNRTWELGYGPTATQLVGQLVRRGLRGVTGVVIGDASLFDSHRGGPATGLAPDIPDLGGQLSALTYDHGATAMGLSPGAFAARELTLALRSGHVSATASRVTARTPRGARVLASVSSPPLSALLRLMNVPSDDFFAEMLTKQLGARLGGAGSIAAGSRVIARSVAADDVHPVAVDGSGLSRNDHTSALQVVALLRTVWHTPAGSGLWESLPVVGETGTVRSIASGTAAQGRCIAKTGTLDNVTNLAGYCHSLGRQVLAFALFIDGPDNATALALIGRMVVAIARY